MTTAWLNPKLHKSDSEAYRQSMTSTDKEVLYVGPSRSGKTITGLRKHFGLHFKNYGMKSAIIRANAVDLHDSIREDIKFLSRYSLEDPRCPFKIEGGSHFHTIHINGGRCVLGGMNRPGRILGVGLDLGFYSQAEQSTPEDLQIIKTRMIGGNWIVNGEIITQLHMDCNPERRDHHLLKRRDDGLLRFIEFGFKDNPYFFRNGRWSKPGKTYVEDQNVSLEGVYHDRFFKGLWADPEGAVFQIQPEHITDELPDPNAYLWYNAMDFGMTEPSVCLWIGEHAETGDVIVAKEFRHTKLDIIAFGSRVRDLRKETDYRVLRTVIDNDENNQKILVKQCGIVSEMARKGPGSRIRAINLIQNALRNTIEGRPGGLRFFKGLRDGIRPDPVLIRGNRPLDTIVEMRNLQFKPEHLQTGAPSDELPVGRDKHGIDALGYWFDWRDYRTGAASFASGATTRKARL